VTNLLDTGAEWLSDMLHEHASETVTYQRGNDSVSVTAVIGTSYETEVDTYGIVIQVRHCDFLIQKSSLNFGAGVFEPQPGDRIERASGEVWQVQPAGGDRGYRETSHALDAEWRVHTKRVS